MTNPEELIEVREWYSPGVPRNILNKLMERTNGHAAFYFGLWFLLLGASGYLAARLFLAGSWWALPAFFVYGVIYTGNNPRWHETSHGTPFKTSWLNEFFYFLCGAMEFRDTVDFRWSHARHHSFTKMRGIDPEIAATRPPDLFYMIIDFFYLRMGITAIKNLFLHSFGIAAEDIRAYVPDEELPKMYWSARAVLVLHLAAAGLAVYLKSWLPVLLFGLPRFYGAFFMWTFIWLQHVGLRENVWDHRLCTRSLRVNFFFSFLFMNMENHVEHHLYPAVPFHKLPALREEIKDKLPKPYGSMWQGSKELIPALFKQKKDPEYSIIRPVPESAGRTKTVQPEELTRKAAFTDNLAWYRVCGRNDIENEDLKGININGRSYIVYRLADGYYATDGLCTHEGAPLSKGFVTGDVIECARHNARFHIPSGKALRKPAKEDLRTYPVKTDEDDLLIGLPGEEPKA